MSSRSSLGKEPWPIPAAALHQLCLNQAIWHQPLLRLPVEVTSAKPPVSLQQPRSLVAPLHLLQWTDHAALCAASSRHRRALQPLLSAMQRQRQPPHQSPIGEEGPATDSSDDEADSFLSPADSDDICGPYAASSSEEEFDETEEHANESEPR